MSQARTKTIAALLAVVLVVSAIAVGLSVLTGGGGDDAAPSGAQSTSGGGDEPSDGASDGGSSDGPVSAPYAAAPCPDPLPDPTQAGGELPALDDVVAVRLCGEEPTSVPADALVDGLGAFTRAVQQLPPADTDLCEGAQDPPTTVLVVETRGGDTTDVRTGVCDDVSTGSGSASGVGVVIAFLDALGVQRTDGGYDVPASTAIGDLTCATTPATAPVDPKREQVEQAVLCDGPDATAVPLEGDALDALTTAWGRAPRPSTDGCAFPGPGESSVVLRTDLGDVVRLEPGCGGLVLTSSDLSVGEDQVDLVAPLTSVVPVELRDLGG
ncbi:hypothetical protein [Nocardioides sp. CFH 31398]|uniref:hypothetical protein n=1 Tax=Nocardioides sp. CFH 31398 TaxID=2919579 RepID=UPI001F06B8BB|nr:hypothetical protein [Nocardioides sp. CFH 31398]MCH1866333.1 hypothetical protein [Nocardioides sp. CFH 31398]